MSDKSGSGMEPAKNDRFVEWTLYLSQDNLRAENEVTTSVNGHNFMVTEMHFPNVMVYYWGNLATLLFDSELHFIWTKD